MRAIYTPTAAPESGWWCIKCNDSDECLWGYWDGKQWPMMICDYNFNCRMLAELKLNALNALNASSVTA